MYIYIYIYIYIHKQKEENKQKTTNKITSHKYEKNVKNIKKEQNNNNMYKINFKKDNARETHKTKQTKV